MSADTPQLTWAELRAFAGPPAAFWPAYLAAAAALAGAARALLLRKQGEAGEWQKLGEWTAPGGPAAAGTVHAQEWMQLANDAAAQGQTVRPIGRAGSGPGPHGVAVRVQMPEQDQPCIAAFLLTTATAVQAGEIAQRLALVADVPLSFAAARAAQRAREDADKLAAILDILAQFNAETRFQAALMALSNAVATRFQCDRASIGWLNHGFVRLQAISRTERFDRKMAAVSAMEAAMEEALDQDEEIVFPPPPGAAFIARDHQRFAEEQKAGHLVTLPIRIEERGAAALTCERQQAPFTETELQQLRLLCDQAARRLHDLHQMDRFFLKRWAADAREKAAKLLGPEHTWAKLAGLSVAALLILLVVLRVPYRVEAKFILRAEETAYLSAPFKGFIQHAPTRPGDVLTNGQLVLRLNTDELLLEQVAALAEISRYQREAERARAAKSLAEMRVAEAQAEQARARLEAVKFRLAQADLRAPFAGVITEGDLRERIGAPVDQGETLVKIAQTAKLYVEAEIPERDVHEIKAGMTGQIAFVSQPNLKHAVKLTLLEPAAAPKEGANVFLARGSLPEGVQPWWRPGMSGVCKLDAGRRSLLWIATHRTTDFLRLKLWW